MTFLKRYHKLFVFIFLLLGLYGVDCILGTSFSENKFGILVGYITFLYTDIMDRIEDSL